MSTEQKTPTHDAYDDDEIDLRELVRTLIARKKTIFLVAAVTVLLALTYALLATPVYKATATFLPPSKSDIAHLNIAHPRVFSGENGTTDSATAEIYTPDQEQLYQRFAVALESRKVYWDAFNDSNLASYFLDENDDNTDARKQAAFEKFIKKITLERPTAKKGQKATPNVFLSVRDESPDMAAKMANTIAETANTTLVTEVVQDVSERITLAKKALEEDIKSLRTSVEENRKDEIEQLKDADLIKIKEINDQISELRVMAKQKRMDEIEQLKEADALDVTDINEQLYTLRDIATKKRQDRIKVLTEAAAIAKKSDIIKRSGSLKSSQSLPDTTAFYTEINTQQQPLYLRGEEALLAEIEELKSRKSDDPFIPELRDLQLQLSRLKENQKIALLANRINDDPFIPELRDLEKQLSLLKTNRKVEALLNRKDNDPFIDSLREKQVQLEFLNSIKLDPTKVSLASFDQQAFPPMAREKPKRSLIVALGMVLGLFLGIIAAFMQNFWLSVREAKVSV